jgi:hypothetical protein
MREPLPRNTLGTPQNHQFPVSHGKRPAKVLRLIGGVALAAVLGWAFMGHLSPEMTLHWENLMALCGF